MACTHTLPDITDTFASQFFSLPKRKQGRELLKFSEKAIGKLFHLERKHIGGEEKRVKKEVKPHKKASLNDALSALNKCFTINKNVKKEAYWEITLSRCQFCHSTKEEAEKNLYECSGRDGKPCDFTHTYVDYCTRDSGYKRKTAMIISIISMIRNNRLPIKFGKNDGIVYFEWNNNQVSFHDPKGIIKCKAFDGKWNNIPNKRIPFVRPHKDNKKCKNTISTFVDTSE